LPNFRSGRRPIPRYTIGATRAPDWPTPAAALTCDRLALIAIEYTS